MYTILYKSAEDANLAVFRQNNYRLQYDYQLHEQLEINNSNLLHVSAQFHDSAEFVDEILNDTQSSEVKRSMLTWKNSEGETALHIASRNGRSNIVRVLIEHAQALDSEDLESGVKISEEMMRASDQNGDTALHVAARNNHPEVAELLLTKDPHFQHPVNNMKETPLYLAIERKYHDIVNSILRNCTSPNYEGPDGKTALHAAVLSECDECIPKILLKNPTLASQADEKGWIPLHYAVYTGSYLGTIVSADSAYTRTRGDDNKTAMHIAACRGMVWEMKWLLNHYPDCWVMVTSKGQNVLHLVVENQRRGALEFILGEKWAINLINQKDAEGNTPLHLFVKSASKYFDGKSLLKHPLADWNAVNKQNFTPLDLLYTPGSLEQDVSIEKSYNVWGKLYKAGARRGARKLMSIGDDIDAYKKRNTAEQNQRSLKKLSDRAGTHLLVATLIATVTFAAGFTVPGGYDGNQGGNQGMAVLIRKAAFKTFVVTDTIALMSSIAAVFLHFSAIFSQDVDRLFNRHIFAHLLIVISMITMVIAFITGLYTVLQHGSLALAVTVCVVGCLAILLLCCMMRRELLGLLRHVVESLKTRLYFFFCFKLYIPFILCRT